MCQLRDTASASRVLNALKSKAPELVKEPLFLALFGEAAAWEGRRDEALRILDELDRMRRTRYVDAVMVLELCTVLNDRAQRLKWLERGYEERSTQFVYLPIHKAWYAGDPAAENLVAKAR